MWGTPITRVLLMIFGQGSPTHSTTHGWTQEGFKNSNTKTNTNSNTKANTNTNWPVWQLLRAGWTSPISSHAIEIPSLLEKTIARMDATFKRAMDNIESLPVLKYGRLLQTQLWLTKMQGSFFVDGYIQRSRKSRLDEARNYETMPSQGGQWLNV